MIPYILNLFDLFCTLYALNNGITELNPLMQNIPVMIIYKVIIVGILCWWLSRHSKCGMWICTAVYAALAVWHVVNIFNGRW